MAKTKRISNARKLLMQAKGYFKRYPEFITIPVHKWLQDVDKELGVKHGKE